MNRRTYILVLVALFLLANVSRGIFRGHIAAPRYVAEGASHFRYTGMVAAGERIPSLDRDAQWPEGLRPYEETAVGMEYLYGLAYRFLPGDKVDLHAFTAFFTAFLFSLAVFPVALLAGVLWGSRWAGVVAGLIFVVSPALVGRSSGFELIRENVAFPLLALHTWLFLLASAGAGTIAAVLGALALALALASWQGTQFFLLPLLAWLLFRRVVFDVGPAERRAVRWALGAIFLAGLLVPFLRAGRFLLSPGAALGAAWLAADAAVRLSGRGGRGRRIASCAAGGAIGAAAVLVPAAFAAGHFTAYAHFFHLVLYKLRYLRKPVDPRLLPFDARAFWTGPFNSPDPRHLFVFVLPLAFLLPGPLSRLWRRARTGEPAAGTVLFLVAVSFALFLLMMRLLPLWGLFAAVAAGGIVYDVRPRPRTVAVIPGVTALLLVGVMCLQAVAWETPADLWRSFADAIRVPSRRSFVIFPSGGDPEEGLVSWIRANTPTDAVVMSLHYHAPQVLAYAGRRTNLNDFFESPRLRRKAEALLSALYGGEEGLWELCRREESDYLLVSAALGCDPTRDSPLYQAGFIDMPPGCASYLLMFEPERLKHFDLVYENERYRLFLAGRPWSKRRWPRSPLFYEKDLLWGSDGDIEAFYDSAMHVYALTARGSSLIRLGRVREAEERLTRALRVFYFYPAWRNLVELYTRQGRFDERLRLARFADNFDRDRCAVCIELARSRLETGDEEGLRDEIKRCRTLYPTVVERQRIAELLMRLGEEE
ncbi:MAG: hypothetical protein JW876_00030 [Candidatus Krumholzibacteriota bacterium]|nr:hypothetical protein [Candidatus Krumholzibacteriota bacterium]